MGQVEGAAPSSGFAFEFDRDAFVEAFVGKVRPLVLAEWALDEDAVDETGGDPDAIVALVTAKTESSKALVRRHLTEIAEVAGVKVRSLEARLTRLISRLEGATAPVQERVSQTQQAIQARAVRTSEAIRELSEQGHHVIEEVRQAVPQAEEKVKENLWTALLAALGLGVLLGLVVGLSRGR